MRTPHTSRILALGLVAIAAGVTGWAQVKDYRKIQFPTMRPFTVPKPERIVLDNGMVVMLLEDHELPLIEARARIRTGSRLEPADKVGMAPIVGEVMRTGGTTSMPGDKIDDFLEARAAVIEMGVGEDSGFAVVSSLSQDFPDVLKVFADILRNPVFAEEKIKIAKNEATAIIARRNDDPLGIMNREFDKLVYGADSPYARTTEYATLGKITRDDLIAFHKTYVHPNRILLGIAGDFNAKEMADRIKKTFGAWPKGPAVKDAIPQPGSGPKPGISYVQKEDMTQSDIIMGHLGIREDNPDIYAVDVLNEAYGGGFAARLFSNVRSKKGLAYSVRGAVGAEYDYPGSFTTWMTTKVETTAAGIDALLEEIDAIVKSPPTQEEVQRAKESILNSFVFNFDSKSKILNQQLTYEYFGFPSDYLARYRENIEKVTPADVARVAKSYIHKDKLAILVVGPSKGQDRPLSSFGPVAQIDITIPEPAAAAAPAATAESQKQGQALFGKAIQAMGGAATIDAVKAMKTVSTAQRMTPQGEMTLKVVSTLALPDKLRSEITAPMGQMVMVLAGQEGFMTSPTGEVPLPESQRAELAKAVRRQPFVLAQRRGDPGLKLQHMGRQTHEGASVEELLVSLAGDEVRLFVEPSTGRILKQSYRAQDGQGPGEFVISYSDFREVSGLTMPFKTITTRNGEPFQTAVAEEITVNPEVDAAMFTKQPSVAGASQQ